MSDSFDILVTLGHRYQIIRLNDNTPMGASYATRKEAEDVRSRLEAESYGYDWEPTEYAAVEGEVSARTVLAEREATTTSGKDVP